MEIIPNTKSRGRPRKTYEELQAVKKSYNEKYYNQRKALLEQLKAPVEEQIETEEQIKTEEQIETEAHIVEPVKIEKSKEEMINDFLINYFKIPTDKISVAISYLNSITQYSQKELETQTEEIIPQITEIIKPKIQKFKKQQVQEIQNVEITETSNVQNLDIKTFNTKDLKRKYIDLGFTIRNWNRNTKKIFHSSSMGNKEYIPLKNILYVDRLIDDYITSHSDNFNTL